VTAVDASWTVFEAPAVAVRGDDIDTDRIIPARFAKAVTFDALGEGVFADDRAAAFAAGRPHPFDDDRYDEARILVVNRNFGCGSSREHAVAALLRWRRGISAIVGESFSTIFAANCLANGIPTATAPRAIVATLMDRIEENPDLVLQLNLLVVEVVLATGERYQVQLPDDSRRRLLDGTWDSLSTLLAADQQTAATAASLPYLSWAPVGFLAPTDISPSERETRGRYLP
jgi:3-isopropylmalate/(R)-2-methylmalate dehydratase small subunit